MVRSKYLYSSEGNYQQIIPTYQQDIIYIIEKFNEKSNYFQVGDYVCGISMQSYLVLDVRFHGITTIALRPITRNLATTFRMAIDLNKNEWALVSRMFKEGSCLRK